MSGVLTSDAPVNQSVERAVRLLNLFTPDEPELSLGELTARLRISKATAHRYATALRKTGLLRYEPTTAKYTLGPRIVELAAAALAGLRIVKIAGPQLERLVVETNETAVLSVFDGTSPVVVRVEDNTDRLVRIVVRTGARLPLETSAQGKVFCAFASGVPRVRVPQKELDAIRATRIATNSDLVQGIRAIATPVFQESEVVAAMALVGTAASIADAPSSAHARSLVAAADALSTELGFLPTATERSA